MKNNVSLNKFNRGMVSPLALARTDLENIPFFAEEQTNWIPRILGSMMLRPGFEYKGATLDNAKAINIEFIYSLSDMALLEFTDGFFRPIVNETVITRPNVTTAITNDSFATDLTGWTDADQLGATSQWVTGGYMSLAGTKFNAAIRRQLVTVAAADQNVEHGLRIVVYRGDVTLRLGSTSGGAEYLEYSLGQGTHSIAVTPTADFYVEFRNKTKAAALIASCSIESQGEIELETEYAEADLISLNYDQSGNIVYLFNDGYSPKKVERRGTRSWSFVDYQPDDGPFRNINTTGTTITPSAISGDVTLTASSEFFKSTMVGGLIKIDSTGQTVSASVTAENQFTNYIRVTGTGTSRSFDYIRSGTYSATWTLQRSVGEPGSWVDVVSGTTNATTSYNDALDNQIVYYRIGVKTSAFTSGTAVLSLDYANGSITGIARITEYTSETVVSAGVIEDFGDTTASDNWYEGAWSDYRGYPSACCLHDGRFNSAGRDKFYGTVSDAYESFDSETEGDSGPISRSIGKGPVDTINWMLSLSRLVLGGQGAEWSVKTTTFDEPITPTNFTLKDFSTQGSHNVMARKIDGTGIFVHRSQQKLFQIVYNPDKYDYESDDLTKIIPEICGDGIVRIAVQRQPDTRIHAVRTDGKVAVMVYDPAENVKCFVLVEADGLIEDAVVLPGVEEDEVYYIVKRTINGNTVRYREKWAMESECQGGTLNKQLDSFYEYSGASTTTITGLSHLEGEEVYVWAGGVSLGTYTVSGGQITGLSASVTSAIVGLTYRARFKSSKLAYAAAGGTALAQRKIVTQLGIIARNIHQLSLKYGGDFDNLDNLPKEYKGEFIDDDAVTEAYDLDMFEFNDTWSTDSRICLEVNAPYPCTLLATVIGITTHDKA